MAEKKSKRAGGAKRGPRPSEGKVSTGGAKKGQRAMEKTMASLQRALEEQEFESLEEANAFLQQFVGRKDFPLPSSGLTPLERAQDIAYEAWEATTKRRRVELARRALEVSADCADAYVILAEETARTAEEARDLYEQGVTAGERALGKRSFKEMEGHFWGFIETRPYMRAREGLADALWELGERDEAVGHYREMLRLNPNDNQGIRYILATCLLQLGDDTGLGKLLKKYERDPTAAWLYTRALWLFRREGAGRKADAALAKAFAQNPFVPLYLSGFKKLPKRLPAYIGFGDEDEAVAYVYENVEPWAETPGAVEWFADLFAREVARIQG